MATANFSEIFSGNDQVRFMLCPGEVISKYDGETHKISAHDLMNLYGVKSKHCVLESDISLSADKKDILFPLKPRSDGNYRHIDAVSFSYLSQKIEVKYKKPDKPPFQLTVANMLC